jgi:hypothetical protein
MCRKRGYKTKTIGKLRQQKMDGDIKNYPIPFECLIQNLTDKGVERIQTIVNKKIENMVCYELVSGLKVMKSSYFKYKSMTNFNY